MSGGGRCIGLGLCFFVAACHSGPAAAPARAASSFAVAVEGNCAKLHVDEAGNETVLVVGTYGLDEAGAWSGKQTAHAAQALAFVRERTAKMDPALLTGLPLTASGWIEGDVEVGGGGAGFWLERVVRTPAALNKGALFEVARDGFTWEQSHGWRPSAGKDSMTRGPHTTLPVAAMFCDERSFSLLASERAADGTTFVAGRCEDELHRPNGDLGLARYDVRTHQWQRIATPRSALFEGAEAIVNAGITVVTPNEAWVHAYRPFAEGSQEGYLLHVTGSGRTVVATANPVPFAKSIVSVARATDGTLWTVAGFSELYRRSTDNRWDPVALPPLAFVEPVPATIKVLEVQTTGGASPQVWVHGAVPIVRADGSAGREHVLFTSAPWAQPLHCDRSAAPQAALAPQGTKVRLASLHRKSEE